jgi:energy-coupling factor transport system substrate-specific component
MKYQRLTRTAILIAICVVLGYLFLAVPNLEMITAGIFISGVWMGPATGMVIGFLAEAIYSLSNPMGFPPPPLLLAQVISMTLVGMTGGLLRSLVTQHRFFTHSAWLRHLLLAGAGLILTLVFDFLTTLSFPLTAGFSLQQMGITLGLGIPFMALHLISNTLIFALVVPVIINRFPAWRNP